MVLTHSQIHKLSPMFILSPKLFQEKIRANTKVRALSKSFLRNMMEKVASNAKGMITFKLTVSTEEHLPLGKLKRLASFT